MSERQLFRLVHPTARQMASRACIQAPDGYVVEIKPRTRSLDQNARMWAMLAEIAQQVEWHGQKLAAEDWKHVFSASLKQQRAVPGLDGGFVVLGQSTSKMTIREMSDLMEVASAFGAQHEVRFSGNAEQE
jgi:NinB protein